MYRLLISLFFCVSIALSVERRASEMNYQNELEMPGMDHVVLYWNVSDDLLSLDIAMEAVGHRGYVAFGINKRPKMGGTDTVIGWVSDDGIGHIGAYNLTKLRPHHTSAVPEDDVYNITNHRVQYYDGATTIFFTREASAGQHRITNASSIILAALGDIPVNGEVAKHTSRVSPCPEIEFFSGTSERNIDWLFVHGVIMFTAWGFIIPIGVMCARYLRRSPTAIWFRIHRVSQPVGYVVALVGVIIIFYHVQLSGGSQSHYNSLHGVGGIILMGVTTIHIILSVTRPPVAPEGKSCWRIIWENMHLWIGRLLVVFGWGISGIGLCTYTGHSVPTCVTNETYKPYFIAYFMIICIYIVNIIAFEIHRKISREKDNYIQVK